jgi:MoxR-like ATPase
MSEASSVVAALRENINSVVLGKSDVVESCLTALLAGEHLLLEDVPGVGKTLVGKAIARSIAGEFRRIQFTSDLLPSDIVGSNVFNSRTSEFSFHKGPIFANVVLADEINRAPPRTQSALLEAMSERQVSVDGETLGLPNPFIVIATQNPFEMEGTYSLPESQMDRFLLRISMGYPGRNEERQVLASHRQVDPVSELKSVVSFEELARVQGQVKEVKVDPAIESYLLEIANKTRNSDELRVGVSTRAVLSVYRAAQAKAILANRDYVVPDDVKTLAVAAMSHRVIAKGLLRAGQRSAVEAILVRLIDSVAVPT